VSLNCHAEEVVQGTEIFHGKLLQGINHTVEELLRGGSEDNIVHIQKQVDSLGATSIYEQRCVCLGFSEPQ